ncbi:type VI secretion system Vgr family protein [Zobellia sp. 1_MG-2023]|uniref:type VI secretion system Vgr family protein n=1 Tax=Zobellia sp. 1_MG-2023 TaxID=3062626 RepID=UPI0026E43A7F|nr:phage baseplate assembly protein V [Zobellia sp. 1_MG-2023]MDO6819010.1 phage baseplate assembly protein V [Zobellia sp. 1_MG-2023]
MSKIVDIKLILNGNAFLPNSGYSVSVEQAIGGHSTFRIAFPAHATETYAGPLMKNALGYIGKKMSIGLNAGQMEFTGIVTNVDLQKGNGAAGTLVISGHGPSVLLANSAQCLSYEEGTSLSQVVEDTLKGHSTDILKKSMGTGTDFSLPYTVQYNESDLSFLQRLCSRYGVWLYHNGRNFCVGKADNTTLNGVYGIDVLSFNLSTSLKEQIFDIKGHDWVNDTFLEASSTSHAASSSHPYHASVKGESDTLFNKKSSYDYTIGQHEYSAQGGLDTAARVNTLGRASGMVTASGTSELVALRVGDTLSLKGLNFSDPKKQDPYGSYDIIKVVHRFDHSGHYSNSFEGVPEGTEHLPYSNSFAAPRSGAQRGWVLDNADPEGLSRIKVQFPWQKPMGTSTPWIKMVTPYSGSDKGFYFIPEKEEEVLVGFEADNPEKPFVLSAGFNSSANSGFANADNNIKAIKTRSGHTIELNDTDGGESITITDKNENIININTASNDITISAHNDISITAAENMTLNSKNMQINVEENLDISVGANKTESINEGYTLMANTEEHQIGEDIKIISSSYKQEAQEISTDASGGITTNAGGKITIASGDSIEYGE